MADPSLDIDALRSNPHAQVLVRHSSDIHGSEGTPGPGSRGCKATSRSACRPTSVPRSKTFSKARRLGISKNTAPTS